jgi:CRISPR/Cas system CSM-associated protein Csm2 small subunit
MTKKVKCVDTRDGTVTEIDEEYWTTLDGRRMAVGDMDDQHVRNALRMVIRRDRKRKARLDALALVLRPALKKLDDKDQEREQKFFDDLYNEVMGEDRKWGKD